MIFPMHFVERSIEQFAFNWITLSLMWHCDTILPNRQPLKIYCPAVIKLKV